MFTQISTGNRVEEAKFKAQSCKGGKKPPKLQQQQQQRYSNGKGCWSQCRKGGEKQRRAFAAAAAASAALKALHHRPERGLGHTHSRCLKIER